LEESLEEGLTWDRFDFEGFPMVEVGERSLWTTVFDFWTLFEDLMVSSRVNLRMALIAPEAEKPALLASSSLSPPESTLRVFCNLSFSASSSSFFCRSRAYS